MNRARHIFLGVGLLLTFPVQSQEVIRLSPGHSASFSLQENVSTGYSWRIDQDASERLDILAISDAGRSGASGRMVGSPSVRRWTIRALKPGRAEIVLAYQRPWELAPVETRRVGVVVSP